MSLSKTWNSRKTEGKSLFRWRAGQVHQDGTCTIILPWQGWSWLDWWHHHQHLPPQGNLKVFLTYGYILVFILISFLKWKKADNVLVFGERLKVRNENMNLWGNIFHKLMTSPPAGSCVRDLETSRLTTDSCFHFITMRHQRDEMWKLVGQRGETGRLVTPLVRSQRGEEVGERRSSCRIPRKAWSSLPQRAIDRLSLQVLPYLLHFEMSPQPFCFNAQATSPFSHRHETRRDWRQITPTSSPRDQYSHKYGICCYNRLLI